MDGTKAGTGASVLQLATSNSTINGLLIEHSSGPAVVVTGSNDVIGGTSAGNVISGNNGDALDFTSDSGTGNLVQGNYFGTDVPNGSPTNGGNDVYIAGGTVSVCGNVIDSASGNAVDLEGGIATISNNFIGTDSSAASGLGNSGDGIVISNASATVSGNMIDDNGGDGLNVFDSSVSGNANYIGANGSLYGGNGATINGGVVTLLSNTLVQSAGDGLLIENGTVNATGNYIGTDSSDRQGLGNSGDGVLVSDGSVTLAGNVVDSNTSDGVQLDGNNAIVTGNYVGTDASGTTGLGNGADGIYVDGDNNSIGGYAAGDANVIAGNLISGVAVFGGSGNAILGNSIYNNAHNNQVDSISFVDNATSGGSPAFYITVNGVKTGSIAYDSDYSALTTNINNALDATFGTSAVVCSGASLNNLILTFSGPGFAHKPINSVTATITAQPAAGTFEINGSDAASTCLVTSAIGLGIDLGGDGVTPNNSGPGGPNNSQNYPVLTSATVSGGIVTISGTLDSTPGTYTIDFYANLTPNPTGYGEGETYLAPTVAGLTDVTTTADPMQASGGSASFTFTLPDSLVNEAFITATATDANNNTSEFSQFFQAEQQNNLNGSVTILSPSVNPAGFGQSVTLTATIVAEGAPTGMVTFLDGSTSLGTATLNSSDQAQLTTSALTVGPHDLTAQYSGDTNTTASTSANVTEQINPDATTTMLASSSNVLQYGDTPTLTATVAAQRPARERPAAASRSMTAPRLSARRR